MSNYIHQLQVDSVESTIYYKSSINKKTEQQKELEKILKMKSISPQCIADIACGGGGLSLHLSEIFPLSEFILIDANQESVSLARKTTENINATCMIGDIYNLQLESDSCDMLANTLMARQTRGGATRTSSHLQTRRYDIGIFII